MKKSVIVAIILFAVAVIMAYYAPEEAILGNSYKLIYLHLPMAYISFFSIFLCVVFSVLSLKNDYYRHAFVSALLGLGYGLGMLLFGFALMKLAWGGISLSEPRFQGGIALYFIFSIYLWVHKINKKSWTAIYSVLGSATGAVVYFFAKESTVQLHPTVAALPPEMMQPMYIFLLAFSAAYYYLFNKIQISSEFI